MSRIADLARQPISLPNVVILCVAASGALVAAILGNWLGALFLGVLAVGGLAAVLVGRRPTASDVDRVNALEYRDERDHQLATRGFAVVGAVALCLAVLETVAAIAVAPRVLDATMSMIVVIAACVQQAVLYATWGVANVRAARIG